MTGLSAAYYLKKNSPSQRVVILEASGCGNGASGRNGAMLLSMTEDRYMQWSGDPILDKRIYELTTDNIRRLKNLSGIFGIDVELEQNGALQVCNSEEIAGHGRAFIEKARPAGMPFEFWDRDKIFSAVGTSAYQGALFDPCSGQLHPGKLVSLFKAAAESVGVEIFETTRSYMSRKVPAFHSPQQAEKACALPRWSWPPTHLHRNSAICAAPLRRYLTM